MLPCCKVWIIGEPGEVTVPQWVITKPGVAWVLQAHFASPGQKSKVFDKFLFQVLMESFTNQTLRRVVVSVFIVNFLIFLHLE